MISCLKSDPAEYTQYTIDMASKWYFVIYLSTSNKRVSKSAEFSKPIKVLSFK